MLLIHNTKKNNNKKIMVTSNAKLVLNISCISISKLMSKSSSKQDHICLGCCMVLLYFKNYPLNLLIDFFWFSEEVWSRGSK